MFSDRISQPTYYQFGAYQLQIELLRALFPQGEDHRPQLTSESAQGWTLNSLANSYSLSGQPGKAVPLFERRIAIGEKQEDKKNLAIALGNLADDQLKIGVLQATEANLRRRISLFQEIEEEFREAISHAELGRLLAYRGAWAEAEAELSTGLAINEKRGDIQSQLVITERSGYVLQGADVYLFLADQALAQGNQQQALEHLICPRLRWWWRWFLREKLIKIETTATSVLSTQHGEFQNIGL